MSEQVTITAKDFVDGLIKELTDQRAELRAKLEAAERRIAEAEAFKTWVHQYLDSHDVPHHPPGVHGAEGCRIGDRMDWLMNRIAQLAQQAKPVEALVDTGPGIYHAFACSREAMEWRDNQRKAAIYLPVKEWHYHPAREGNADQQAKPVDWEAIARINWKATWNTNGTAIEGWAAGAKAVIAAYTAAQSGAGSDAQDKAND